jgi:hypothetical protein
MYQLRFKAEGCHRIISIFTNGHNLGAQQHLLFNPHKQFCSHCLSCTLMLWTLSWAELLILHLVGWSAKGQSRAGIVWHGHARTWHSPPIVVPLMRVVHILIAYDRPSSLSLLIDTYPTAVWNAEYVVVELFHTCELPGLLSSVFSPQSLSS